MYFSKYSHFLSLGSVTSQVTNFIVFCFILPMFLFVTISRYDLFPCLIQKEHMFFIGNQFHVFCVALPMFLFVTIGRYMFSYFCFLIQKVTYYMCSFVLCKDFKAFGLIVQIRFIEDFGNLFQANGDIFWFVHFMKDMNNQMAGRARMQLGLKSNWNSVVNIINAVFISWSCLPVILTLFTVFVLFH